MQKQNMLFLFAFLLLGACNAQKTSTNAKTSKAKDGVMKIADYIAAKDYSQYKVATLAGGCFWCTEAAIEQIEGVVEVISGYSGGDIQYPTYYQVASGRTKHAEAIQIYYDPAIIDYNTLLHIFFTAHDPTTLDRQGPDVGPQYRSEIFYHNEEQKATAKAVIKELEEAKKFPNKIVTKLGAYKEFWTAEAYHQDYYLNNPTQPYVMRVSRPKVEKVKKVYKDRLKAAYK